MAVQLERLIASVSHMDIQQLAGEQGMNRMVHWVHMVETTEACQFLDGNEIAFTTGIGLNSVGTTLLDLVKELQENHAAALIVNLGPYVENVEEEVIEYCNVQQFPLFTVPWRIHIAEMIRVFSFSITKSEQKEMEIASAFKNAIYFPRQEELYLVTLSKNDFYVNWQYCAAILKIKGIKKNREDRLEQIHLALSNYMCHYYDHYALFVMENKILLVMGNYSPEEVQKTITDIRQFMDKILLPKEYVCYGVGKCTKSIRCLYKSYGQAMSVQKLQAKGKVDYSMIYYTEMGIYKLLMEIEDKEVLRDYYEKTIQPLVAYDAEHKTDLTKVLQNYLKYSGSVKETASQLFVHRNSINYKLHKISEILQMDLSTGHTRTELEVGFMLQDML